jgi:GNAT superfamily N-acetyltransferase
MAVGEKVVSNKRDIERAIEGFVYGLCFVRSFTHPFLPERVGRLWVARDGPRKRGDYRNEEWAAFGVKPAEVDWIIRGAARSRFAICEIHPVGQPDEDIRREYKALGYRLLVTEPLMMHSLKRIPKFEPPAKVTIEQVLTQELADRVNKAARRRQVLPQHLNDPRALRQYAAVADGKIVGWVRSVKAGPTRWCSNMYVAPAYRRRGIGRAMLSRMLLDDRKFGARAAVLTASRAGALLYPLVGYEHLATLYVFKLPAKSPK